MHKWLDTILIKENLPGLPLAHQEETRRGAAGPKVCVGRRKADVTGSQRKRPLSGCRHGDSGPNLTRSKLAHLCRAGPSGPHWVGAGDGAVREEGLIRKCSSRITGHSVIFLPFPQVLDHCS